MVYSLNFLVYLLNLVGGLLLSKESLIISYIVFDNVLKKLLIANLGTNHQIYLSHMTGHFHFGGITFQN